MKFRILIFSLISVLVLSCSSEETAKSVFEEASQIENSNEEASGPSYSPIICPECDENYTFPEMFSGGALFRQVLVTFDANATEDEIHCFKFKLFECLYKNRLYEDGTNVPLDPNSEYWYVLLGKPDGDLLNDICNDPLTSGSSDCD